MHPEIKKFLDSKNKSLKPYYCNGAEQAFYYNMEGGEIEYVASTVAFYVDFMNAIHEKVNPKVKELKDEDWIYFFSDFYLEKEMLKIIKLKAFI